MKFTRIENNKKVQLHEFILVVLLGFAAYFLIVDSFVYFYSHYIWYSFAIVAVGCFIFCNLLPKKKKGALSDYYYLLVSAVLTIYTFWFTPKMIHFLSFPKNVCFNAILTHKQYFYTQNQTGSIEFYFIKDINNKLPKNLVELNSLNAIPEKEYDKLPNLGKKIEICGTISNIGFSFDYIENLP